MDLKNLLKEVMRMLNLSKYLAGFRAQLAEDASFRAHFDAYLGDVRRLTDGDADEIIRQFRQADESNAPKAEARSFMDAIGKVLWEAMRLALAAEAGAENAAELRQRTVRLLLTVCRASDWYDRGDNDGIFRADLITADICINTALLTVLLRDAMTAAELNEAKSAVVEKGVRLIHDEWVSPLKHWHALDTMGHNWFSVVVAAGGVAAVLLMDECPECQPYLENIITALRQWIAYPGNDMQNKSRNFDAAGDYLESVSYMCYAISNLLVLATHYQDATGSDALFDDALLRKQVECIQAMTFRNDAGEWVTLDFNDCNKRWGHEMTWYLLVNRLPECASLLQLQDKSSMAYSWGNWRSSWREFLYQPLCRNLPIAEPQAPPMAVYRTLGAAVIRTGERIFAMRCGESWNHSHLDAGSFILTAGGAELISDSGKVSYSDPEYTTYFSATPGHNTLMLDGRGQDPDMVFSGSHVNGDFPAWVDAGEQGYQYLRADCTGPYTGVFTRFFRHALALRDWTLLIDDVQAFTPGELTWMAHTDADCAIGENAVTLKRSGHEAVLYPIWPVGQSVSIDARPGKKPCLNLTHRMDERRSKKVVAISHRAGAPKPEVRQVQHGIEIILHGENGRERVILNTLADGCVMHRNSWFTCGEVYTDAFLTCLREDKTGNLTAVGLVNGSQVHVGDAFACGGIVKTESFFDLANRHATVYAGMPHTMQVEYQGCVTELPLDKGENEEVRF